MTRFVHSADWQIGMTRRWLHGEAQARFGADRIGGIRRIGQVAAEQDCEFVVVAGDVFESNQLHRSTVLRALEAFGDVPVPVYLLPGNHDPLDAMSVYRQPAFRTACPGHVHVLDRAGAVTVRPGLEIVAAPWHGKHPESDLVAEAVGRLGPADGTIRILVGHGAVDLFETSRHHRAAVAVAPLEQAIAQGRLHYVALGDRHSRTQVGPTGAIWYAGAHEVTDHREEAPGDVLVVDVEDGRSATVQTHRVGSWRFPTITRELTDLADVRRLDADLSALPDKERTVVRLKLRGALGLEESRVLTQALELHAEVFGGMRDWEVQPDLVVLSGQEDWAGLGLGGFVAAAVAEISAQAGAADPGGSAGSRGTPDGSGPDPAAGHRDEDHLEPSGGGADLPPEPEPWVLDTAREPDSGSARDALSLLYRLTKEGVR